MRILVNATALDSRGAYSVVNSFLSELNSTSEYLISKGIELHFLVAKKELCKYSNESLIIKYEPYPKKGLINKWRYERVILPRVVNDENYDAYLSLQNYILKHVNIKQFVLIHQPIPFAKLRLCELEIKNWIKYRVLFKKILLEQRNEVAGVIVQTNWMKNALVNQYNYKCPIIVIRPTVRDIVNNDKPLSDYIAKHLNQDGLKIFYPTNNERYKNNKRLIKSVIKYNKIYNKKVILFITLEGKSNEFIKFIGKIPYNSIYTFYKNINAVIFSSLAETFGLPLLEAKLNNIPIIASNLPYAREICRDSAIYFEPRNVDSIVESIHNFASVDMKHRFKMDSLSKGSYLEYIDFIINEVSRYNTK